MLERILLPRLDQGMEEGTVIEWLVAVGDDVASGEPLVEIETEKVSTEIESPVDGVLLRVDHGAGERVAVGTVIGWIGDGAEEPPALTIGSTAPQPDQEHPEEAPEPSSSAGTSAAPQGPVDAFAAPAAAVSGGIAPVEPLPVDRSDWVRPHAVSPRVRAEAASGTAAVRDVAPVLLHDEVIELDRQRRAVVATVTRSWQAPQFVVEADVNATRIASFLESWRTLGREPRLTLSDLIAAAIAAGAAVEPGVNAWFEGEAIRRFGAVDVTLLAQVGDSLLMPLVADVGARDLAGIAQERSRVVGLARAGRLGPAEMRTGSIALSNLAATRVDRFTALLIPPQVAVVAAGRVRDVAGTPTLTLRVTLDHRAVDGVAGARFLGAMVDVLEEPLLLTT